MKKFIIKSSLFTLPFLLLYLLNITTYQKNQGDLVKLGYLYTNPCPKELIKNQYSIPKQYTLVSELNLTENSKKNYDVLIIGDSFSGQDSLGYKNFLAEKGATVLHMDRFLTENPVQKLIELMNGDFFDSIQPKYIVLQSVERWFVQRFDNIDFSQTIKLKSIKNQVKNQVKKIKTKKKYVDFFSRSTLEIPLINTRYLFSNNPAPSQTYKVATNTNQLFTNKPANLLFYQDDLDYIQIKNDSLKIAVSNMVLNKISDSLSKKNIELIFLLSPDKYDMYYPYIKDTSNFKPPLFFNYFDKLPKRYHSVPSYNVLSKELSKTLDIYYYDDTHWSPKAASLMADEIFNIIENNEL
jgi:hypothetical protein